MKRRRFLKLAGFGALSALTPEPCLRQWSSGTAKEDTGPNIVIILSDDVGYAGLSCQGAQDISTPNLDSLARDGTRCTNAYASGPVCAPTRAGLMTGRYQNRFGYETLTGSLNRQIKEEIGVPTEEIFFPEILQKTGYKTAIIGKWHLGVNEKFRPNARGFDEFFGFLAGDHDYFTWNSKSGTVIYRNSEIQKQPPEGKEYLTDVFSAEAVSFIERNRSRPFLLYLAYNAVHPPLQVPEKYTHHLPETMGRKRKKIVGMTEAMDSGIGRVLEALRNHSLEEKTLVIFFSDNGGGMGGGVSENAPLSGGKGGLKEGGIRVPFILRWPGQIPAGRIYAQPIISLDIFPSVVAAAGRRMPQDREIDGVNLLPYLKGERPDSPHEYLFFRHVQSYAVRRGNEKLFIPKVGAPPELYDLETDVAEKKNLAAARPEVVEELKKALEKWESRMVPSQSERLIQKSRLMYQVKNGK
jgi:arylsulfatase A-like enzyme